MRSLVVALLMLQLSPSPIGVITGSVSSGDGMPVAGVRVFAVPAATGGVTILESQTTTDATGRYRLEVPAGRYYVATGSVGAPTYFPTSDNATSATVISVAVGSTTPRVDFTQLNRASLPTGGSGGTQRLPGSASLSGEIRLADGGPASGIVVLGTGKTIPATTFRTSTDSLGRYRFENVPPDTYYIVAGSTLAPTYFPGTGDIRSATTVSIAATNVNALNFQLTADSPRNPIRGRVLGVAGIPEPGATVILKSVVPNPSPPLAAILALIANPLVVPLQRDGTFEIADLFPGNYSVTAFLPGMAAAVLNLTLADKAMAGVDLSLPVARIQGEVQWADGRAFSNPQEALEIVARTVSDPNVVATSTPEIIGSDGPILITVTKVYTPD